jgi:hypothetical protein
LPTVAGLSSRARAQAAQQGWLVHGGLKADHAAHRQPDQVHRRQVQVLEQGDQVGAEAGDAVAFVGFVGAAVAAHIGDDDPVMLGQRRDLVFPVLATGAQPMDQHERVALAVFLIVQRASIVFEIGHR